MLSRSILLVATVLSAAFAGCSDAPPSGALADLGLVLQADGTAGVTFTHEENPVHEQTPGGVPDDNTPECVPDTAPDPLNDFKCVEPETNITIHFMSLPDPGSEGYEAFLTGSSPAKSMGMLEPEGAEVHNAMYNLPPFVEGVDYSLPDEGFDTIEIRVGDFVYASAPLSEGEQAFTIAGGLDTITAAGEYKSKVLTVTVSGLPVNGTYTAHFYQPGEDGVTLESKFHAPIANGVSEIETDESVDKYVQFHIHVGDSKVNIFQAAIE